MKILIISQIMDRKDSTLGFFHVWTEALAPHYESVELICLKKGECSLPSNVRVHSLGKESVSGNRFVKKLIYTFRFYKYIFKLAKSYDSVFVHMNQEYVLLAGWIWKLMGKKIYMWRNHYAGSILTDMAAFWCDKVFCTSRFSYTAKYPKTVIMPVGVDTTSGNLDQHIDRIPSSILSLGRLDPSKRPEILIDALGILRGKNIAFTATFVGGSARPEYVEELKKRVKENGLADEVTFTGAVPNTETFRYYRSHEIFVNSSRSGMLDKTIFKAIVCGCLVAVNSRDFEDLAGKDFVFAENSSEALADKLESFLAAPPEEKARLQNVLSTSIKDHGLPVLVRKLVEAIV